MSLPGTAGGHVLGRALHEDSHGALGVAPLPLQPQLGGRLREATRQQLDREQQAFSAL